jgi:hypothetical protein
MLQRNMFCSMPYIFLVIVGWLYVALMMALAEATHSNGSVAGAVFTFLLYGVFPVAIVIYIMMTPARKRAIRARAAADAKAEQAKRDEASGAPDGGGEAPADAVAPVRKEP